MKETDTLSVSKAVAKRVREIARGRGVDVIVVTDEYLSERLEIDEAWKEEVQGIIDTPASDRRVVSHEEARAWVHSYRTDIPLPRPKGKPRL